MNIIPGKNLANEILTNLVSQINSLSIKPKLAIIQAGDDESSKIYVNHKISDAKKVGIESELFYFDHIKFDELSELVHRLNSREDISGYIIQLPLPLSGELRDIFPLIDPSKDVDGLNPFSLGRLYQGEEDVFLPATVLAILECLKYVNLQENKSDNLIEYLTGKNIVIVNDSIIVGRPLAATLLNSQATVTICNKYTKDLAKITSCADILVSATGVPKLITCEMVKQDAVVIDVAIKRTAEGISGDVDFKNVSSKAKWITPVPGGVGPLTRAMLLQNVMEASLRLNLNKFI